MGLAVGEGLRRGPPAPMARRIRSTSETLAPVWTRRFVAWAHTPDHKRAPGVTSLPAGAGLSEGKAWVEASVVSSKGCGANMRVTPIGLVSGITSSTRAGAAQLQAALTHGHPTGMAASELTACATWWLLDGMPPRDLPGALRAHAEEQRKVYHHAWLGGLWERGHEDSAETFMARGWADCLAALKPARAQGRCPSATASPDPCDETGEGWIAEEALATSLLCFLLFPDDPRAALQRAATTRGDSDSIAALAGAFAGAAYGIEAFPAGWRAPDRVRRAARGARRGAGREPARLSRPPRPAARISRATHGPRTMVPVEAGDSGVGRRRGRVRAARRVGAGVSDPARAVPGDAQCRGLHRGPEPAEPSGAARPVRGHPADPARGEWYAGVLPDRITIFRLPILQSYCRTREQVVEEVRKTVDARGRTPFRHRRRAAARTRLLIRRTGPRG